MTVYGKQCVCGSWMHEVIGGYHCEECETMEAHDWDKESWAEIFGVFVFLLVEGGIIFIAFQNMGGGQ